MSAACRGGRAAVFLDRDGTLIEQVHYLADPNRVRLLPGVAEVLRRLGAAGFARVVVTNQSAVGRGYFTEEVLRQIHEEMERQLAAADAAVDAIYYCTFAPNCDDRSVIEHPDRKPGPGMLLRAADDLSLDLSASWMVGDMLSDVLTGINAGCRGSIFVQTGKRPTAEEEWAIRDAGQHVVIDLLAAAALILDNRALSPTDADGGAGRADDDRDRKPT